MSVRVMVIPLGITTTWMDPDRHKDGIFMEKYEAVQVRFSGISFAVRDWFKQVICMHLTVNVCLITMYA